MIISTSGFNNSLGKLSTYNVLDISDLNTLRALNTVKNNASIESVGELFLRVLHVSRDSNRPEISSHA